MSAPSAAQAGATAAVGGIGSGPPAQSRSAFTGSGGISRRSRLRRVLANMMLVEGAGRHLTELALFRVSFTVSVLRRARVASRGRPSRNRTPGSGTLEMLMGVTTESAGTGQRWLSPLYRSARRHESASLAMATVWTHELGHLGSHVRASTLRENKLCFALTQILDYMNTRPLLLRTRHTARQRQFLNVV